MKHLILPPVQRNLGRISVIFTLCTGILIHSTRLIVGPERFQLIFTPQIDAVFTIPIILGIVGMFWMRPYYHFRNRWEQGAVIFTQVYFIVSLPLHLQTWFSGSTEYTAFFPWWYSLIFLGYSTLLIWVWVRLRLHTALKQTLQVQ